MSDPLEEVIKLTQKCIELVPAIVLGSGASRQYRISGMGELKEHLLKEVKPVDLADRKLWEKFTAELARCNDLEVALHNVQLSPSLEAQVVRHTRQLVLSEDLRVFEDLLARKIEFPLSLLIRHLLRSTYSSVSIITTNYDRLAEYAADAEGLEHTTGFTHGYYRFFNPGAPPNSTTRPTRSVEVLKVHGSVDWFQDTSGAAVCLPDGATVPKGFQPLMVTPGTGKYALTHEEPFRTIIGRSDDAFAGARAVLTIGYGFNDRHIQPKLTNRVLKQHVPVVVLARTLTPMAKNFIAQCKHNSFLALEASGTKTRAYFSAHPNGFDLPVESLWEFGRLLAEAIGKP